LRFAVEGRPVLRSTVPFRRDINFVDRRGWSPLSGLSDQLLSGIAASGCHRKSLKMNASGFRERLITDTMALEHTQDTLYARLRLPQSLCLVSSNEASRRTLAGSWRGVCPSQSVRQVPAVLFPTCSLHLFSSLLFGTPLTHHSLERSTLLGCEDARLMQPRVRWTELWAEAIV
jgi:hypothetical protein